jgi:hypothetical protein
MLTNCAMVANHLPPVNRVLPPQNTGPRSLCAARSLPRNPMASPSDPKMARPPRFERVTLCLEGSVVIKNMFSHNTLIYNVL